MFGSRPSRVSRLRRRRKNAPAEGQTLVEYTLILAIISILALAVFTALGNRVIYVFSAITSLLDTDQSS
jgi:Flp pilus assembly pilin Flp